MSFKQNEAIAEFPVSLVNKEDGSDIDTGTPVGFFKLIGGSQSPITDTSPVYAGNGVWTFDIAQAETNAVITALTFTHPDAITRTFTIKTVQKHVSELNDFDHTSNEVITDEASRLASQADLSNISTGSPAISTRASDGLVVTGIVLGGSTYEDTFTIGGATHSFTEDGSGNINVEYIFQLQAGGVASEVVMNVNFTGNGDTLALEAYNQSLGTWEPIGMMIASAGYEVVEAKVSLDILHTGTGANEGKVRVRAYENAGGLSSVQIDIDKASVDFGVLYGSVATEVAEIKAATITNAVGADISADIASAKAESVLILEDTNELQVNQGDWATPTGFATETKQDTMQLFLDALHNLSSADVTAAVPSTADIEGALLNESDGQQLLNAIVSAIGNQNIDEIALVAAIRADIERVSGMLDSLPSTSEFNARTLPSGSYFDHTTDEVITDSASRNASKATGFSTFDHATDEVITDAASRTASKATGFSTFDHTVDEVITDSTSRNASKADTAGLSTSAEVGSLATAVDAIQADLDNGTDGLSALKTIIDTKMNESSINTTDGVIDEVAALNQETGLSTVENEKLMGLPSSTDIWDEVL